MALGPRVSGVRGVIRGGLTPKLNGLTGGSTPATPVHGGAHGMKIPATNWYAATTSRTPVHVRITLHPRGGLGVVGASPTTWSGGGRSLAIVE